MLRPFFLIACLAAMAGCNSHDTDGTVRGPDPLTTTLADTSWRLAAINGSGVTHPAAGATLTFNADGTGAGGNGSCNSFGTMVASDGSVLSFSPVIATERACFPETRMVAEEAYFDALQRTARFVSNDTGLTLFDAKGQELLHFERVETAAVETDLIGTRWSLGDLEGSPAFGLARIAFNENGELTGQGPCNSFAGDYRLGEGMSVEIMPRETTRCFCEDFDRERQFFDALRQVRKWRIDGERLLLQAGDATLMILEIEREAPKPLRGC